MAAFAAPSTAGQPTAALSAAAELPQVALTDAFELLLLLRGADRPRFERAALRWHGRHCREVPAVGSREATAVLALLASLVDRTAEPAARALAELFHGRGLEQAARILMRWADTERIPEASDAPSSRSAAIRRRAT